MAELKSPVMGQPSGRVHNSVYRVRYGKVISYARPINQKVSKTQKAVRARKNFAAVVAIAKSVNSVPKLKEIWQIAKVPGTSAYHKTIRRNSKSVIDGLLTTENVITPEGLPLQLNSAAVNNKILSLSFGYQPNSGISFPAVLYVHLYFGKASGTIVSLFREITEPQPGGNYNIEITLDSTTKKLLSKDPNPIIYAALTGGTVYKNKVYWTTTASAHL